MFFQTLTLYIYIVSGMSQGIEKGREEALKVIINKLIDKFPQWSDAEVAAFLEVEEAEVELVRSALDAKD